ncbi:MAG: hypothetical protein RL095_4068 [Verrucomicrobiota bacterium]|jgi:hypothetical protein
MASWKTGSSSRPWLGILEARGKSGKHGRSSGLIYLPMVTYLKPGEELIPGSAEGFLAQFPQLQQAQSPAKTERRFFTWTHLFGDSIWILFLPALFMALKQRPAWYFLRTLGLGLLVILALEFYLKWRDPSALTWFLG